MDEDDAYVSADDDTQIMTFDGLLALELIGREEDTPWLGTGQSHNGPEPDGDTASAEVGPGTLIKMADETSVAPSATTPPNDELIAVIGMSDQPADVQEAEPGYEPTEPAGSVPGATETFGSEAVPTSPRRSAGGFEEHPGVPRHPLSSQQPSTTGQETKMLNIDFEVLSRSLEETKAILKRGLCSADIFDSATGLSLVGIDSNPAACALLTENSAGLRQSLNTLGQGHGRYHLIELSGNKLIVVLWHGEDLLESWLLNLEKVNLGMLFAIAIPQALAAVERARPTE